MFLGSVQKRRFGGGRVRTLTLVAEPARPMRSAADAHSTAIAFLLLLLTWDALHLLAPSPPSLPPSRPLPSPHFPSHLYSWVETMVMVDGGVGGVVMLAAVMMVFLGDSRHVMLSM